MKPWGLPLICFLACRALPLQAACSFAEGNEILGKDLAAAAPAFAAIPADLVLSSMPVPGSKRTFSPSELASLAQRYSIPLGDFPAICFEWRMGRLDGEAVIRAMRSSIDASDAGIEVEEMTLQPVPVGTIEFPRAGLGKPGSSDVRAPVLWRGQVVYGRHRLYPVWARVRIAVPCTRVIAAESLKPGVPIGAHQLRSQAGECFPDTDAVNEPDRFVGLVPVRPVMAGAELRAGLVAKPNDVRRGEMIEVEVRCGAARLALTAKAEGSGRSGDLISVLNPSNNRVFQARISGKQRAVILADVPGGH